jgi:hypothetical protein
MKKLALTLALLSTFASAEACCYRGYYHHGYYGGGIGWVAPAVVGGVIGYELARPNTVIVEQPPVVYVQPQAQQPVLQSPPVGYHWQQMIDPQTNTQKIVLVPN